MNTRHAHNDWYRLVEAAVDGELSEPELEELRQEMDTRQDLRDLEAALLEMRELVRTEVELVADAAPLHLLWPRIEQRLEAESAVEIDALTLQSFADGELSGAEAATVAAQVAESPEARQRLSAMAEMGSLLQERVEGVADTVDFDQLWHRLDAEIGGEIEARGGFRPASEHPAREPRMGWLDRVLIAIGGYRAVAMSVATAVLAVMVMLFVTQSGDQSGTDIADGGTQALEIRVVHVNEVRSAPGYNVHADTPTGAAPVIYIHPVEDAGQPSEETPEHNNGLFDNPI